MTPLKKRIVFALTINDGVLFRTHQFIPDYRYTANFVDTWSVDEIVLLDVTRRESDSSAHLDHFLDFLRQISEKCFVPVAAGGWIRSLEDAAVRFSSGADKVVVNTLIHESPDAVSAIARAYGSQSVVGSVDAKRSPSGGFEVFTQQGTKPTGLSLESAIKKAIEHGCGELLVNSIDRDGTLEGYDAVLIEAALKASTVPIVICGGAGSWSHFKEAFELGVSAAATTHIFHFTESSIRAAKTVLTQQGVKVR